MEELKGTKEYLIRSFTFYYNNTYLVYKDTKYKTSY